MVSGFGKDKLGFWWDEAHNMDLLKFSPLISNMNLPMIFIKDRNSFTGIHREYYSFCAINANFG